MECNKNVEPSCDDKVSLDDLELKNVIEKFKVLTEREKNLNKEKDALKKEIVKLNIKLVKEEDKYKGMLAREKSYQNQISLIDSKIDKVKKTISFQLGYSIIQATKSWSGLVNLPSEIFRINKESKLRAKANKNSTLTKAGFNSIKDCKSNTKTAPVMKLPIDRPLRVAGVMDEFTFHSYEPECELLQIEPDKWMDQLNNFTPDFVFIESAWKGVDGSWQTKISNVSDEILSVIQWCRGNNIPTLFWNKEDPVHFDTFIEMAKKVDYVFTTDIDCVPRYKAIVGHERVHFLPFAAQIKNHNPIELYKRKDAFNFAGSYYLRYPERQRDFAALIGAVKAFKEVDIYDRNFDNPHPHYTFPDQYKSMILGRLPFSEIGRAYKGYKYGINMNTIKNSQTMFARRVFELLASNTVVVSNFSRGVRLLFGDLVICSDNEKQLKLSLSSICNDELKYKKFRLQGLRKVMSEHTYTHRLMYISSKLSEVEKEVNKPDLYVLCFVDNNEELNSIIENFNRQAYTNKKLIVYSEEVDLSHDNSIKVISSKSDFSNALQSLPNDSYLCGMSSRDYYGNNYLVDLQLATTYFDGNAVGKLNFYHKNDGVLEIRVSGREYTESKELLFTASALRSECLDDKFIKDLISTKGELALALPKMLSIDEFNYIKNVGILSKSDLNIVSDDDLDQGVSLELISKSVANVVGGVSSSDSAASEVPRLSAKQIASCFNSRAGVDFSFKLDRLIMKSKIPTDKHAYFYANKTFSREELNLILNSQFQLVIDGSLEVKTVFEFQDKNGAKISHQMNKAGGKHSLAIPEHCSSIRFGFRVQGGGSLVIRELLLGRGNEQPSAVICRSKTLVLTKQYPSYEDLYKYGFLHSRIRAYKESGVDVDIFRINNNEKGVREFEGIDVISGDKDLLDSTLAAGHISHVLVHMLDSNMWNVLKKYIENLKVTVWVHGAEIQHWKRREFEFERMTSTEVERQKRLCDKRNKFWKELIAKEYRNFHMVFVSEYFVEEVSQDLNINFSKDKYSVIHNYVDNNVFLYQKKQPQLRNNVLSIRSFASRKYGNDLSVNAILELSTRSCFDNMKFHLVGDGELFDELTAPLKNFKNVIIDKRFLTHSEIATLQNEYGVFLNPTRWDSQGVSRDEAMSSGLVPVTNDVAAVSEFADNSCARIVPKDAYIKLADALEELSNNEALFLSLSSAAAARVRMQCGYGSTINKELKLIS
ncbi:glycosyl transferase family 1 [Neptunomonas japonica JAMM 1380]|uniref:Glycosyl transferase family 1 n=2 Tax=Neptunomonas TaxID=75687 RepID=A0A7R6SWB0_9GAMM|nr:glycosyl transferase family 1 [Neptunomonas japonica JAMM 1380]